jgi:hypothetical protein
MATENPLSNFKVGRLICYNFPPTRFGFVLVNYKVVYSICILTCSVTQNVAVTPWIIPPIQSAYPPSTISPFAGIMN